MKSLHFCIALGLAGCAAPPPPGTTHAPAAPPAAAAPAAPKPQAAAPAASKAQAAAPAPKAAVATAPKATAPTAAKPPAAAAPKPAAALDLKGLEQRLKETDAIGLMTKLSLKNQVDDLVARFKAFHAGSRPPTLEQLRPSYDLLLMKVLSLLQDKDPRLAGEVHASREALWSVLADPNKLAQFT